MACATNVYAGYETDNGVIIGIDTGRAEAHKFCDGLLDCDNDDTSVPIDIGYHVLGAKAKERFNPSRLRAGALSSFASVLDLTGSTLSTLGKKNKAIINFQDKRDNFRRHINVSEMSNSHATKKNNTYSAFSKMQGNFV